jgi:putative transposase
VRAAKAIQVLLLLQFDYNLELMRLLDEQYTKVPFYGVRRLTAWLRALGYIVNSKRVRVLMRRMALQAIYPNKRRSFSLPGFNKKRHNSIW